MTKHRTRTRILATAPPAPGSIVARLAAATQMTPAAVVAALDASFDAVVSLLTTPSARRSVVATRAHRVQLVAAVRTATANVRDPRVRTLALARAARGGGR